MIPGYFAPELARGAHMLRFYPHYLNQIILA